MRTPRRLFLCGCKGEMRLARFRAYRIWRYHNGLGLIGLPPVATVADRLVLRGSIGESEHDNLQDNNDQSCGPPYLSSGQAAISANLELHTKHA